MHNVYTTINPKTGELTTENEFVNSWKWKYTVAHLSSDSFPHFSISTKETAREALISKYSLDRKSLLENALEIHRLNLQETILADRYFHVHKELNTLIEVISLAASENKALKSDNKKEIRKHIKFKQEIKSFLKHKEDCEANIAKKIGRIRNNIECTCGLKEIMKT